MYIKIKTVIQITIINRSELNEDEWKNGQNEIKIRSVDRSINRISIDIGKKEFEREREREKFKLEREWTGHEISTFLFSFRTGAYFIIN